MTRRLAIAIAAVVLATPSAAAERMLTKVLPPPEFDVPFRGSLTIWRTESIEQNVALLKRITGEDKPGVMGFAKRGSYQPALHAYHCDVFIVREDVFKPMGYTLALLLRHELGHCNGWPGDHRNGLDVRANHPAAMPEMPPDTIWLNINGLVDPIKPEPPPPRPTAKAEPPPRPPAEPRTIPEPTRSQKGNRTVPPPPRRASDWRQWPF